MDTPHAGSLLQISYDFVPFFPGEISGDRLLWQERDQGAGVAAITAK